MRTRLLCSGLIALALSGCAGPDESPVLDPSGDDVPGATTYDARGDRSAAYDLGGGGDARGFDGGATGDDALGSDAPGGDATSSVERCNGVDDNGNGMVDEGCACTPGMMQPCYPGVPRARGVGTCRDGMQSCEGAGEFGTWGMCTGAVTPATDTCGDHLDQDCNGTADDGPDCCHAGSGSSCYSGPMGTLGHGMCRAGTRVCAADGSPGPCMGEVLPRPEACNGVDDNCDGMTDENCRACIMNAGASTPWEIHPGVGPHCFGRTFSQHGDPGEYAFASIPPEMDAGWRPHAPLSISFDDPSTLCGVCECLAGGDFTYFQTSFFVPVAYTVSSMRVNIANVDDGVGVAVFNSRYPAGIVDPGAFAFLGGGSTGELARYIVPGHNRVVLTHVDDCCSVRRIANATITLNGTPLMPCAM